MYDIRIIDNGAERSLDLQEASFPYNFEASDVAQIKDASANWSYGITIPKTANNKSVFKHASSPFVQSDMPYKRLLCNVYSDGIRIVHNGVLFLDAASITTYSIQILSGVSDVFERMKDIDFEDWNKDIAVVIPMQQDTPIIPDIDYAYPDIKVTSDGKSMLWREYDVADFLHPVVSVRGLLDKICSELGYSFSTNTSASLIDDLWMTLPKCKLHTQGHIYQSGKLYINPPEIAPNEIVNQGKTKYGKAKVGIELELRQSTYVDEHGEPLDLDLVLLSYKQQSGYCMVKVTDSNGGNMQQYDVLDTMELNAFLQYEESHLYDGFKASMEIANIPWRYIDGGHQYWFNGLDFETRMYFVQIDHDGDNAQAGDTIKLYANLGYKTAQDFFKTLCQIFGWIVTVNSETNTINAYTMGYVQGRKAQAKDWTDKVVMNDDQKHTFQIGDYGRSNIIRLAENKITAYQDQATFAIPNEQLKDEQVLVDVKVTSGTDDRAEQYEYDEEKDTHKWKNGSDPHLLIVDFFDPSQVTHYTASDMRDNYAGLIDMLQAVEVLTCKVVLNVTDIINFNPYTPIYLRQTGKYYYVNKISQWEARKSCEIELIAL